MLEPLKLLPAQAISPLFNDTLGQTLILLFALTDAPGRAFSTRWSQQATCALTVCGTSVLGHADAATLISPLALYKAVAFFSLLYLASAVCSQNSSGYCRMISIKSLVKAMALLRLIASCV